MLVKSLLRSASFSKWAVKRSLTANLHLIPQLCFGLFGLRGMQTRRVSSLPASALALSDLARVHECIALEARKALAIVIGYARRHRRCYLRRRNAPRQPLSLVSLQLIQYILHRYRLNDVLGGGGENGEDSEATILLILFKSPAKTG